MIHPHTRLIAVGDGLGVIATQPIPAGTLVWVLDPLDIRLDPAEVARLAAPLAPRFTWHAYLDHEDQWVMCWDHGRYLNHHCDYNCVMTDWGLELAGRDIAAGEQLSNEYALFKLAPHEEFDCHCGSPRCRGHVDSHRAAHYRVRHDALLDSALARVAAVEQPLWPLLDETQRARLAGRSLRRAAHA